LKLNNIEGDNVVNRRRKHKTNRKPNIQAIMDAKERRKQKVASLMIRKMTNLEVATAMGLSTRSIERYRKELAEDGMTILGNFKNKAEKVMAEYAAGMTERIRQLWINYHQADAVADKTAIMRTLAQEDKQFVDIMQSVGFMPRVSSAQIVVDQRQQTINITIERQKLVKEIYGDLCPKCKKNVIDIPTEG